MIPVSVRLNNPGNIRIGSAAWQGLMPRSQMTPEQAAEKRFCVFVSPVMGFRALARLLINYNRLYGIDTLRAAISRFAPENENDTEAYLRAVCDYTKCGPDTHFGFKAAPNLQVLCKAISIHEAGGWFFTQSDLAEGVRLALAG